MSETSARALRSMLRGVVEAGTATGSSLSSFDVAGKTGTARRAINGKYVDGKYNASFVGMFPADDPQLVILVKLDDPTKSIYGGRAAAPVSRVVLQAALAAREASLNRSALARADAPLRPKASPADAAGTTVVPVMSSDRGSDSAAASAFEEAVTPRVQGATAFVAQVGPAAAEPIAIAPVLARVAVPDVRGLPMRRAVYEIHRAGFRASLGAGAGGGDRAEGTAPAAGSYALTGTVVAVSHKP
jgi:cell division protein FtsI (penicillin-binding protein 3)